MTFVVTGDAGQAAEDLACAEYIGQHLAGGDGEVAPYLHRARTSRAAADLADGVRRGYQGVHPDDVDLCLEVDTFSFAMVARKEDSLTVLRPATVPDRSADAS
ncbi:2-phosphosulfolactate phosphatase [Streptomyces sp. NPDC041003]|uniref:2-phosphosulfolactate phosphatase n=1 Tax=Streptomyces sp. NPDC041003 TaxID=3155730 RepID=UPI0033C2DB1A